MTDMEKKEGRRYADAQEAYVKEILPAKIVLYKKSPKQSFPPHNSAGPPTL